MREPLSVNEMLAIRRQKLAALRAEGRDPHRMERWDISAHAAQVHEQFSSFEGQPVSMGGRILGKRGHGKILFLDLQDASGRIQLVAKFNEMGAETFSDVKKLDLGDIVGVTGTVFRTDAGEISVLAKGLTLLTKSLQLLPEKFHGLTDMDLRYRQRYLDLIVHPEVKDVFVKRTKILSGIRRFLDERQFLEVETPILNTIAGGATARPFITHHNTLDIDMYLRIANELYLKRLIVGGFERVYEMGRMFRNEGMDTKHNPEYTAIELYQAFSNLEDMMALTERLIADVCIAVNGSAKVTYQGTEIDFTPPWSRITMTEAVLRFAGVDFRTVKDDEAARALCREHGIELDKNAGKGKALQAFFDTYCEEKMVQPTFVFEYPVEISPLTKRDPNNPEMTRRFEAFVHGAEIANAYSELNDAEDQRQRFERQVELRNAGDEEANMMDEDFLHALEVGMPPTGGLGIGIDRVVMLLTDQPSIREVLLFPTMKPLRSGSEENEAAE